MQRPNTAGAGAIGFIYYSGHGAAAKDTNIKYLIPVYANEPGTFAFWDDSVKLDDVLRLLDGARAAAKFIVFDACRSELQLPTKDTTNGLVPLAKQQRMFIAYASAPGHTASDKGRLEPLRGSQGSTRVMDGRRKNRAGAADATSLLSLRSAAIEC